MSPTVELLNIKADIALHQNNVIKENEVMELLKNEFPTINNEFERSSNPGTIYMTMRCFAALTKQFVRKGDFKEVKHCFIVAERMMQDGNKMVKNAIENCYLFSISRIVAVTDPVSKTVKDLLTDLLRNGYNRQVCASGI